VCRTSIRLREGQYREKGVGSARLRVNRGTTTIMMTTKDVEENQNQNQDVNEQLRALEPTIRDANAFKARSALIAMRKIVTGLPHGADVRRGVRAVWSGVREILGSARSDIRTDATKTVTAFATCDAEAIEVKDLLEEKLEFAWTHANWRFRVSGLEILGACVEAGTANEDEAREAFKKCAECLRDREAAVREKAMETVMIIFGVFPDAVREEFESERNEMRPQHAKDLERRFASSASAKAASTATTEEKRTRPSAVPGRLAGSKAHAAPIVDGLVPPAPERISTEKELTRAMDRIARDLSPEQDWLKRIAAMVRLEAIALGGGGDAFEDAFATSLVKMIEPLTAQVSDRRSAVVKQAAHLLVALARSATNAFEPCIEPLIMALLRTTVITIAVIADSGNACIRGIITHCQSPKVVQRLADAVSSERSPKMRAYVIEYLTLILKSWELSKRNLDAIGDVVRVCLSDADASVRANAKACFEILSVTSPAISRDILTRVDSKLSRSLSDLTVDSVSEDTGEQRAVGEVTSKRAAPSANKTPSVRRTHSGSLSGGAVRIAPNAAAPTVAEPRRTKEAPPKAESAPSDDHAISYAVMFAERVERAAEHSSRAEASARLRDALDEADTRTHGARAVHLEAQVALHAPRIAELLLGFISDTNGVVLDAALESVATLVCIASEEVRQSLPDLCLGVFECLTDYREATRTLSSEALAAIGDMYTPDHLLPALLRSLHLAATAKTKTGVLEFALYVLCGRGGGSEEVLHAPASVSEDLESWIDMAIELACDVDASLAKAAGSNLAAIHSHVDGAVVPRRLLAASEYKRVRFMDAVERRVPKLADLIRPFLERPPSPPTKPATPVASASGMDDDEEYEDQNVASLNRSYESMRIDSTPGKPSSTTTPVRGLGERIVAALEGLRDDDVDVVVDSLKTIASVVEADCEKFTPYLPLVVSQMCSAMDDINENIAAHAFWALKVVFNNPSVAVSDAIASLAPMIHGHGNSVAPLFCASIALSRASKSDLEDVLPPVLTGLVEACDNRAPAIRQSALNALGLSQRAMGPEWMRPHVQTLSLAHRQIMNRYADAF
jgi:CLIP-associating protein 1/2